MVRPGLPEKFSKVFPGTALYWKNVETPPESLENGSPRPGKRGDVQYKTANYPRPLTGYPLLTECECGVPHTNFDSGNSENGVPKIVTY